MIRKFFADFVVVVAVCAIVWGSAPVWAACPCTESPAGTCASHNNEDVRRHADYGMQKFPYLWKQKVWPFSVVQLYL